MKLFFPNFILQFRVVLGIILHVVYIKAEYCLTISRYAITLAYVLVSVVALSRGGLAPPFLNLKNYKHMPFSADYSKQ